MSSTSNPRLNYLWLNRAAALAIAAGALGLAGCAPKPDAAAQTAAAAAADENHPGKAVYETYCSSCHDNTDKSGAPARDTIRMLSRAAVRYTLTHGYMRPQTKDISQADLTQLIDWLPRHGDGDVSWEKKAQCAIKLRRVELAGAPRTAVGFGLDPGNNRAFTAAQSGLAKADLGKLELAWSMAFPSTASMRSQPVIVGDTMFLAAVEAARIYALDAGTGCIKWVFAHDATLRSSLVFAEPAAGRPAMILGSDAAGQVIALNAETGVRVWLTDAKLSSLNRGTGAPAIHGDTVFVPLSSIENVYAANDDYECCQSMGAVVALDLATGKQKWVFRTMEEAKPTHKGRTGTQQWGPSGAIIWSTPAVDAKRGVIYVGTGENTSWPATDTSDAIIAIDMKTGARRWVFQATSFDIWNGACGRRAANCDWPGEYHSPDFDFGAGAILIHRPDGQDLVVAGQKSGVVWAMDPDTGKQVWGNRLGQGSALGGIHWGIAYDAKADRIFAPINDPMPAPAGNPIWGPGVHGLDAKTGELKWTYQPTAKDCGVDVAGGETKQPAPEWKMIAVTAPMTPPPRPAARPTPARPAASAAPSASATPAAASPSASPSTPAAPPPAARRCRTGLSAPPLVVDGAVVTGSLSGMLRIHDGETGKVLFEYQTNRDFPNTINGVPGHGGAMDSAPYIAGDGTLFVQSGYGRFGQSPGNVLLAFRPKK